MNNLEIQNNAENKLQKYTTKSNIKLELPEENLKDNENFKIFSKLKRETLILSNLIQITKKMIKSLMKTEIIPTLKKINS